MRFFLMSWFILSLLNKPLWASEEGQLTIGVASKTFSNIYAGASNETRVLSDLKYSKGAFLVGFKEGVSYQLSPLQDNSITVSVVPRFKPYDGSDPVSLVGMNRGHRVDFGIKSRVKIHDGGSSGIQLFKELTNKHSGTQIDLAYSKFIMNDVAPPA